MYVCIDDLHTDEFRGTVHIRLLVSQQIKFISRCSEHAHVCMLLKDCTDRIIFNHINTVHDLVWEFLAWIGNIRTTQGYKIGLIFI